MEANTVIELFEELKKLIDVFSQKIDVQKSSITPPYLFLPQVPC